MLCQFQVRSKLNQLYTHIYPLFFKFFSHIGHYRVLSRVPCAVQQVLVVYLFYIQWCVYVFIFPSSHFLIFFLAALGLRCCTLAFSSCGEWGLLFVAVCRLLIVMASLVVKHGLQARRLQQLWHMGSVVVAHGLQSTGSVVVAHGLSCSMACGIFRDQGSNLCPLN